MYSQNLILSAENPRPSSAYHHHPPLPPATTAKPMSNETLSQKPPPSILVGRFKALLKQRDDELRDDLQGAHVPPPTTDEIVQIYELLLSELTCNLKPIITDLTIIAEQQREHAKGIADAICARILEVPADQKLPALYLLDSIVKNYGQEYVRYFSLRLPEVFCVAYRQVQPSLHPAMRHLFGTWAKVFPPSVLHKIEAQLQFSQAVNNQSSTVNPLRASESPRPSHGIHVNPMYLRQLDRSSVDSVGGEKLDSSGKPNNTNFGLVPSKTHQFVSGRLGLSSSPSRIGLDRPLSASIDEYAVESESPHSAVDFGAAKALGRDEELSEWQRKQYSGDGRNRFQTSVTYSLSNGHQRQTARSLIDAYGSDKSQETSSNKPLLVERLDRNGKDNKVLPTSWQNTEEEEFDWEDMSPTLVDHSRNNGFLPSTVAFSRERPVTVAANATSPDQDIRKGWSSGSQLPPLDDSSFVAEDTFPSSAYGCVSLGQISGFQNQINPSLGSHQPHEAWKIPHHPSISSQHLFNIRGEPRSLLMPPIDNIPITNANPFGIRPAVSRISALPSNMEARPPVLPASFEIRPSVNVHATRPPILNPIFPMQRHVRGQFEAINTSNPIMNHGPNKPFMPEQLLDSVENKDTGKEKIHHLPNQLAGLISSNQQNHGQVPQLQIFPPRDPFASQFSHGNSLQGYSASLSTGLSNPLPVLQFLPPQNIANNPLHLHGGAHPPLPPGRPRAPSQMLPHPNVSPFMPSQQPTVAYSNLINSLMSQGMISLANQPPAQDSVGTEFNPDILKLRHESVINALYGDLPRQCTTCGLRFKCQEEHSSHMDWHVTKNRMSKNRKQKPSRKWFVSDRMWLTGAEALGTESVPGFLPTEIVEEKKDDEELAVPADEDQNTCHLCGEPFDEFYSDEMEEWMYRGAVYLNAPMGTTASMDRSLLGPIIHAKCRSESSVPPSEDFGLDAGGANEEGTQRKRMRS